MVGDDLGACNSDSRQGFTSISRHVGYSHYPQTTKSNAVSLIRHTTSLSVSRRGAGRVVGPMQRVHPLEVFQNVGSLAHVYATV